MAKVIPIGAPVNEAERSAIATLRDQLPAGYLLLHNFEVVRDGESFEVDLAVLAPHAVYLADVKGTRGLIDVYGPKWYPEGRQPFSSPLAKLRGHAKSIKGVITASQPGRRDLEDVYVDAVVILTAPDASIIDQGGRDAPGVTHLKKAAAFFQNSARIPSGRSKNIAAHHNMVLKALQGVSKPRSGPLRFGSWEVVEKLGGTDAYVEYRGFNILAGPRSSALLRAYQADPYKPAEERDAQRRLISTAYRALNSMPGHPSIVSVRDFFATEGDDRFVLVTEDVSGQALKLHIEKPALALTFDQKCRIASDLFGALVHMQSSQVVHRNVSPSNVLVGTDGRMRLTGFDFARPGGDRSRTIGQDIVDDLEPAYMAPELQGNPSAASPSSDLFSAGLVLYELFSGEKAFASFIEMFNQEGQFAVPPSGHRPDLPNGFDGWLQSLCVFEPTKRLNVLAAQAGLKALLEPGDAEGESEDVAEPAAAPAVQINYSDLPPQTQLTPKYLVERRLGKPGTFGVVYKAIDTLGDVSRAIKLVLRDRHSTLDRLKKEYRTLLRVPDHPNVVKVVDADFLPGGGPPFIVFEYVDGLDVGEMIDGDLFAPEDALELGRNVVSGLVHLHRNGVFHCDIKPRNLLWTDRGAKIIDFNVSVQAASADERGGGSKRYLPPDLDLDAVPTPPDLADRDLYALGVTLFEAVSGRYPWETTVPPVGRPAPDPRELRNLSDLTPDFATLLVKLIAPRRADRFQSAVDLEAAIASITRARRALPSTGPGASWDPATDHGIVYAPNTNPYVRHLLTAYSQSKQSNAGTRGLDAISEQTYVQTALDRDLLPSVLSGEFNLVVISGNAGDGKTAFLQQLERRAAEEGAEINRSLPNGAAFTLRGRTFRSNYDGSQDEGERGNEEVLRTFLAPFAGTSSGQWPASETRLIAINEGRLVDFLESHADEFSALASLVRDGLRSGEPRGGIAVVNLNLRSVVADPTDFNDSILERLVRRMTHEKFWEPCAACDLKDRCYVLHNAKTFQDETAGPRVMERLKSLYAITHLRGRLHITLRDLRSALAFTLAGTRTCEEIHELYAAGRGAEIMAGFYFNSWRGGEEPNSDRLLTLLADVDVAGGDDPRLDRSLDFGAPEDDRSLFRFERRGNYDQSVLQRLHADLPRDFSGQLVPERAAAHRRYLAMVRRKGFFERRDGSWRLMLPYKAADQMLDVVNGVRAADSLLEPLLAAINRGEGLSQPERLGNNLALEARRVEGGSAKSYRLYPRERFSLRLRDLGQRSRFVEHMPSGLVLQYTGEAGLEAELIITLDVLEMLQRLNDGYRPSVEEEQGYYLSLSVFKNTLGSAPYQELVVSTSGFDFYTISRADDGTLEMASLTGVR